MPDEFGASCRGASLDADSRARGKYPALWLAITATLLLFACGDPTGVPATGGGTGAISISTSTRGIGTPPYIDSNGYIVTLDGVQVGRINTSGTLTISGVSAGWHQVGLSDFAVGCSTDWFGTQPNPTSVMVSNGITAVARWQLLCIP